MICFAEKKIPKNIDHEYDVFLRGQWVSEFSSPPLSFSGATPARTPLN